MPEEWRDQMPCVEKVDENLDDYNDPLKHIYFLQSHGLLDHGHIVGQIELLKEYLAEKLLENRESAGRNIAWQVKKCRKEFRVHVSKNLS